jgi:hypothetical protein
MSYVFVPSPSPDRALTAAQKRALLAMPESVEVDASTVAGAAAMKPNGAALALGGLERRGLVVRQAGEPQAWTITFAGRALAQRLAAAEDAPPGGGRSAPRRFPSRPSS